MRDNCPEVCLVKTCPQRLYRRVGHWCDTPSPEPSIHNAPAVLTPAGVLLSNPCGRVQAASMINSSLAEIIRGPAHQGRILPVYSSDYDSRHRRAGYPNHRPRIAIWTRPYNRNICCGDFPVAWSHNRCSGQGASAGPPRAGPSRVLPAQNKGLPPCRPV
jgi:hypothetical protein